MPWTLEQWAQVGDAVAGAATAIGVAFAVFELLRRDRAARRDRQSHVAAAALSAASTATHAVVNWLDAFLLLIEAAHPDMEPYTGTQRERHAERSAWARAERHLERLQDAIADARVHLAPSLIQTLDSIHDLAFEVRDNIDISVEQQSSHELSTDGQLQATIREARQHFIDYLEEAAPSLQQLAQFRH